MKTIKLLLLGVAVIFILAACGDNEEAQSEDGVIELTLWNDWTEDRPENTVYKDIIEKFNEQNEEIQIVNESIPHDDYEIKLRTQAAGNQLPDMMRVWPGTRVQPLVQGNALLPLNPIIDHWEGMIPEEILQDYAVDGNYYAIPSNISETSLVFYNKEIVSEAGYDEFPTTYEGFKSLIEELKSNDVTPISLGNKAIWPLQSVYISGIADRYTGSDFLGNVLNGEGTFEDEQFINALSVIDELTKLEAFNEDMNTVDEAQSRNEFIKGSTAMHFAGSWAIGPIMDSVEDVENIGVAAFPSFEGGEGDPSKISGVAGGGIAVNSNLSEAEQEAAFEFLKFYYSEELFQQLVQANIIVPADVEMDDSIPQVFKDANSMAQNGLSPVYDATLTPELTDIINNGLQSITLGDKTPEELAAEMQAEWDKSNE
ncbi:sugar ABC transporter sugar-binding protein [Oceanobacillus iheyensis HTE831]|uniref:Sugar ABC transporter sugar-binding protein n=1 Tax=Oceanobacillus iheyensis (strain DSM 14371 / CIP 107618 / JCM 11309 / KCTC 3954 / HTE831) TaxID=221109 RepID=Q8ES69_OCEIH|nr:extracellular solute-binding protein [Oceanobacillus iheyensis]BAC12730.1 sugar ABC transporter sugar-binding protein [Oceanobacillus iheyensis HTE831]